MLCQAGAQIAFLGAIYAVETVLFAQEGPWVAEWVCWPVIADIAKSIL